MKRNERFNLAALLWLAVGIFTLAACADDDKPLAPFSLEQTYYELTIRRSATIPVTNGSGDISLSVADEEVLQASYEGGLLADGMIGAITLRAKQKGETSVTLTDNVTGETQTANVKVVDVYLGYEITESNHPLLAAGTLLYWVNNGAKDFYLFTDASAQPTVTGTYGFTVAAAPAESTFESTPHLVLNYPSDETGSYLPGGQTTAHDFCFELSGDLHTSSETLEAIKLYLNVDWDELIDAANTRTSVMTPSYLVLTVPGTDYRVTGFLTDQSIPEHLLD